jgi:hypothetical protein
MAETFEHDLQAASSAESGHFFPQFHWLARSIPIKAKSDAAPRDLLR